MTLEEAIAAIEKYTFGAPMRLQFTASRTPSNDAVELVCILHTTDVTNGEPTKVYGVEILFGIELAKLTLSQFHHRVRGLALRLWTHEFDEWLCYDGKPLVKAHL